ncbi:RibD family protein [Arenibaculum pallidiluteum]|uniref:RibD family protein n=1 Tax=Arenibaculum pallidiluteum TaxID=2812559 RepID=UPI001A96DBA7|nr:dihydrofolate reductase family protein [Arenibaculum pallidiluteum]
MATRILKLFPGPPQEAPLRGTYLAEGIHALGTTTEPFVYANFVTSLDGRIAIDDPDRKASILPPGLNSGNDFRLFLELQAQADCLITHGGYLRAVAAGHLDDILQVGISEATRDLAEWRLASGLAPQPAVVVASASLDFPLPASLSAHGQRVMIATVAQAPGARVAQLRAQGFDVFVAGETLVEGAALVQALADRGLVRSYLMAGPLMLETMLRAGALSRLYLTIAHRLIGGEGFHTMITGPTLGATGRMRLSALRYDSSAPEGTGQWFARFEPLDPAPHGHGDPVA